MNNRVFDAELKFTETFRKYKDSHPAIREVMCLKTMFDSYFCEIQEGDLFAGRVQYGKIGFGLESTTGGSLYFCKEDQIRSSLKNLESDPDYKERVEDMLAFWQDEVFLNPKTKDANDWEAKGKLAEKLPESILRATSNRIANMGGRVAGTYINYDKLILLGIPGMQKEIRGFRDKAAGEGKGVELYDAMLAALDLFVDVARKYAAEARTKAEKTSKDSWRSELLEMARVLEEITQSPPESFREGIQLMWLYAMIAETVNYGRMDIYLGDLYAHDLEQGAITEERALELLQSLWRLIIARRIAAHEPAEFNARVVIGGKGRRNEANADKVALLAMEASRTVVDTEPQLTLRFYKGMNSALMDKALDVIGQGRVYPMLYNDDVNIPAAEIGFGVPVEEAEQYLPYGCGEYGLDHISIGSPNCSLNLLKALEAVLHNGRDGMNGRGLGLETGELSSFDTFEKLQKAYEKQVEFHVEQLGKRHAIEYQVEDEMAAFVYVSMLYDGCIEKGKSIVGGGPKYKGGIIESFGIVNAADSLTTIKKLVYDQKIMSLERLVEVLDANYEGFDQEHHLFLEQPKFGNDLEEADRMAQWVSDQVCEVTWKQAPKLGFDFFLVVNINNHSNVDLGKLTAASADGRRAHAPLANGNNPTAGMDKNGVTAFLNSLTKIDPRKHAGYSHNMKFSKQLFNKERGKLEVLLDTYFDKGGTQAMITVVNRGDLENAMREPEKYANLIVRVGGFSARFVELAKDVQIDVLNRTLY